VQRIKTGCHITVVGTAGNNNTYTTVMMCFSQTGKRLMAKCRMLLQENEDLGRSMSSGRIAKLEGDIALQKRLIDEMKSSEKGQRFGFEFVSCILSCILLCNV